MYKVVSRFCLALLFRVRRRQYTNAAIRIMLETGIVIPSNRNRLRGTSFDCRCPGSSELEGPSVCEYRVASFDSSPPTVVLGNEGSVVSNLTVLVDSER